MSCPGHPQSFVLWRGRFHAAEAQPRACRPLPLSNSFPLSQDRYHRWGLVVGFGSPWVGSGWIQGAESCSSGDFHIKAP